MTSVFLHTLYCWYFRDIQLLTKQCLQELQFPPQSCVFQLQLLSQSLTNILRLWFVSSRYVLCKRELKVQQVKVM